MVDHEQLRDLVTRLRKFEVDAMINFPSIHDIRTTPQRQRQMFRVTARHTDLKIGTRQLLVDALVQIQAVGGQQAAELLSEAIGSYIPKVVTVPGQCRIIVRIYANLEALQNGTDTMATLTQDVAERVPWALSSFAAGFSGSFPSFDFVDVRHDTAVQQKISDSFTSSINDNQCKHIFVGAWRRPIYLAMMIPYRKQVTLIEGCEWSPGFSFLGFAQISIPTVFQSARRGDLVKEHCAKIATNGISCKLRSEFLRHGFTDIIKPRFPHGMQHEVVTVPGLHLNSHSAPRSASRIRDIAYAAGSLPNIGTSSFIPINKAGQRLDLRLSPSGHDFLAYKLALSKYSRPYNNYHLTTAGCSLRKCPFSHEPLSEGAMLGLRYIMRKTLCDAEVACRKQDCYYGHICQRKECLGGYASGCKMSRVHGRDPNAVAWVESAGAT